jgi:FixJ family two-component response regulator
MTQTDPTVVVTDDDPAIREALGGLLRSIGLQVRLLASVSDFLMTGRHLGPTCLVLDVRLPGRSGLDFQRELAEAEIHLPIIFITGHGDIPMWVQATKGGAIDFLTKPFRDQGLNKQVAGDLGVSEITIKVHRAQVIRKMHASSLPELARMPIAGRSGCVLSRRVATEVDPVGWTETGVT